MGTNFSLVKEKRGRTKHLNLDKFFNVPEKQLMIWISNNSLNFRSFG